MDDALARLLVDATTDGLWLLDGEGRTLYANTATARLLDRSPDELTRLRVHDVVHASWRSRLDEHLERLGDDRPRAHNVELHLVRRDGSSLWALVSWSPVDDADGVRLGYLHRLTEYTERRALLDALGERERQLAETQRLARLGSWRWDVPDDVVWYAEDLHDILDVDPAETSLTYEGVLDALHPDDREGVERVVLTALRRQGAFRLEARLRRRGESYRWVRVVGEFERDSDGTVRHASGSIQDIDDLRRADATAAEATRRLHLLQQMADAANRSSTLSDALVRAATVLDGHSSWRPVCVWVRGEGGELEAMYPSDRPDADLPSPDLEQATSSWDRRETDVWPVPDRPGSSLLSLPVLAGTQVACVIQLHADLAEPDVHTWALVRQIADQLGRVAERERAATQLAEARDAAMAASRHKSDFLATMSHEIRTPMNGVIGLATLLQRTDLDERQRDLVANLRGAGRTLLALIDDVLDLAKIESGTVDLAASTFEVEELLAEATTFVSAAAEEKGLALHTRVAPDVPPRLVGDPVRLGQVLTNLTANAVKFTEHGEVVVTVDAEPVDGAVRLRVEVRDTGIGIPADQADVLFDAFAQADSSTTREHDGTGLGLAIARRLVERMEGEIGARPRPDGGSVFWFTAMLARPDQPAPPGARRSLGLTAAHPTPRREVPDGLRVLVVEDNSVNRLVATGLLEDLGCEVTTAVDGTAAVGLLGPGHSFDLVLMDCRMPQLDGYDATRLVRSREDGDRVPIVAMTASALPGERERCLASGMDGFLPKPVDPGRLADVLVAASSGGLVASEPTAALGEVLDDLSGDPVLDPTRVETLRELVKDGTSFFERTRTSFLGRVEGTLSELRVALDDADLDTLVAVAHRLKGSALNLGLRRTGRVAEELELAAAAGARPGRLRGVLDRLQRVLEEGVAALRAADDDVPRGGGGGPVPTPPAADGGTRR